MRRGFVELEEHESGRLPGRALLECLAALAKQPVSLEDTLAKWLDMFELDAAMVELAHAPSERYRVVLLANIGDLPRRHRLSHGLLEALHHGLRLGGQRLLNRGVLEPGRAVALRVQNVCTHEAGAEDAGVGPVNQELNH